ncbi:hypothetical protein MVA20_001049 [Salmonella enterica]|nr:hypothetical protein [Salmonella enterica]
MISLLQTRSVPEAPIIIIARKPLNTFIFHTVSFLQSPVVSLSSDSGAGSLTAIMAGEDVVPA